MLVKQWEGSTATQYVYTADDERIATYASGEWQWTVRDGARILRELTTSDDTAAGTLGTSNPKWKRDYYYRNGQMLASDGPEGRRYFHLDQLGTPRLITDDFGRKVGEHAYLPFGMELKLNLAPRENPEEDLKFTSHERDTAAGGFTLDYMHARYYGAGLGRFLSVDPGAAVDAPPGKLESIHIRRKLTAVAIRSRWRRNALF